MKLLKITALLTILSFVIGCSGPVTNYISVAEKITQNIYRGDKNDCDESKESSSIGNECL